MVWSRDSKLGYRVVLNKDMVWYGIGICGGMEPGEWRQSGMG